jgi:hypothetical protein
MKTRTVTIEQNGIVYDFDTGDPVICWRCAAEDCLGFNEVDHPCNNRCAALDVDNVNGPRCLMMPHLMSFGLWSKKEG